MTPDPSASAGAALPLRLTGAVWGHLVGDAMGVPYEFRAPAEIGEVRWGETGSHGQPPGTWSDDGALMLALLDSLVSSGPASASAGGFDTEDQGRRALAWWRSGVYAPSGMVFDIGGTTSDALRAIEAGTPAKEAGPTGERSQSNGSLMRILPVALWGHGRRRPSELAELAMRASRVTHGHPVAQVTCAAYVLVADAMLGGVEPAPALASAIDLLRGLFTPSGGAANLASAASETPEASAAASTETPAAALSAALDELLAWPETHEPEGRGGALNAFWSAWAALEGASSYEETIERAIRFGHDTDTTAAIASGLAGIRWGIDGIPAEWLAGMRGRDIAAPLVDRLLWAHGWKTSTSHPLRVDWVNLASVPGLADAPGRLGMTFLPGKQYVGWHGEWWRDLDADVTRLREEYGCDVFLLLVEDHELGPMTRTAGLPAAFGRTGTAVACLLVREGMEPDAAIKLTRASRRNTIERESQVRFVHGWAPERPDDGDRELPIGAGQQSA